MNTREAKIEYVRDPYHCPYCASTDIQGGREDYEWKEIRQSIVCLDCGNRWTDIYKLKSIKFDDPYKGEQEPRSPAPVP